ncbi:MAG: septum formation initiator family protein [bacterium]|nr:septum formation initiator family protein [bacterium]
MGKTSFKRFWLFRPLSIVAVCFLAFSGWFTFGKAGLWDARELRSERHAQQDEIQLLEQRKLALQNYLTSLRAGDELAFERAARARGFVGPGETIYKIRIEPEKKP